MSVFLEIILDAKESAAAGIDSRDEVEDPLDEALAEQGTAEVTGGGGGLGMYNIDIEVGRDADLESVIEIIRRVLRQRKVPKTMGIKQYVPVRKENVGSLTLS